MSDVPSLSSDRSSNDSSEGASSNEYEYKELKEGYIRILTVYPNYNLGFDSIPDCSLTTVKKTKSGLECISRRDKRIEKYEALSYVWGDKDREKEIHIRTRKKVGTKILKVTENLLSALQHLRSRENERHFWIDAICINQGNIQEVNRQVPLMSGIYSDADNVCIWLGARDDYSSLAMQLLPKIRNLDDFEHNVDKNTTCDEWAALIQLMGREWFTRRWVVQEIALARKATVHCGSHTTTWVDFSEAIALFSECATRVNTKFKEEKRFKHQEDYVGHIHEYPASRLVLATSRLIRKSQNNDVRQKLRSLEYLVSVLTPFNARKPADSVYAVLALAGDVPGYPAIVASTATIDTPIDDNKDENQSSDQTGDLDERIVGVKWARKAVQKMKSMSRKYPVDYNKPFTEICIDFLQFVFEKSGSLDMICRPWAPKDGGIDLPSWIITLKETTHTQRRDNKTMIRKKADVLVRDPGESVYNASGRYPVKWGIIYKEQNPKPILKVQGFILDKISQRDDAASGGVVPETWFELGRWDLDTKGEELPPDDFWRTLVADRDELGRNPPAWYPLACRHTLQFFNHESRGSVNLFQVDSQLDNPALLKRYSKRLQSVIWGRRLGRTEKHKFLTLVPQKASEGDLICIIFGVSVPVVLRERKEGGFLLVGESYVHSMMDGEAFEVWRKDNEERKQNEVKYDYFELY